MTTPTLTTLLTEASPAILEATAAALLAVANDLTLGTPGERMALRVLAAEFRGAANEKLTGVGDE